MAQKLSLIARIDRFNTYGDAKLGHDDVLHYRKGDRLMNYDFVQKTHLQAYSYMGQSFDVSKDKPWLYIINRSGDIDVINTATMQPHVLLKHLTNNVKAAFGRGDILYIVDYNKKVLEYDVAKMCFLHGPKFALGDMAIMMGGVRPDSVLFSHEMNWLVVVFGNSTVLYWDATTHELLGSHRLPHAHVTGGNVSLTKRGLLRYDSYYFDLQTGEERDPRSAMRRVFSYYIDLHSPTFGAVQYQLVDLYEGTVCMHVNSDDYKPIDISPDRRYVALKSLEFIYVFGLHAPLPFYVHGAPYDFNDFMELSSDEVLMSSKTWMGGPNRELMRKGSSDTVCAHQWERAFDAVTWHLQQNQTERYARDMFAQFAFYYFQVGVHVAGMKLPREARVLIGKHVDAVRDD